MLSFKDHVKACEYMGEENPEIRAWSEGHVIGAARIAYVEAHKAHMLSVESKDSDACESTWETLCNAQNDWVSALYS